MALFIPLGVNGPLSSDEEGPVAHPDPEVPERATRRHFSVSYKLRVLKATDELPEGEVSAYLRREGLYWSGLRKWRQQRDEGTLSALAPKKRGRETADPAAQRLSQLERENAKLRKKLEQAEQIIGVQKKLCDLFGVKPATDGRKRR